MVAEKRTIDPNQHPNVRIAIAVHATSDDAAANRIEDALQYINREFRVKYPDDKISNIQRKIAWEHTAAGIDRDDLPKLMLCAVRPDRPDRDGPNPVTFPVTWTTDAITGHVIAANTAAVTLRDIEHAVTHGADVHVITEGVTFQRDEHGLTPAARRVAEELTREHRDGDELIEGIPHQGGRPPAFTKIENGYLRADDRGEYDRACRVLQAVKDGELGPSDAAASLDVTRKTIDNMLDRPRLYRLD